MGTLQKNVKGGRDRHIHKSFGRSLLDRWLDTPYEATPNSTVSDTSKSKGVFIGPNKGLWLQIKTW